MATLGAPRPSGKGRVPGVHRWLRRFSRQSRSNPRSFHARLGRGARGPGVAHFCHEARGARDSGVRPVQPLRDSCVQPIHTLLVVCVAAARGRGRWGDTCRLNTTVRPASRSAAIPGRSGRITRWPATASHRTLAGRTPMPARGRRSSCRCCRSQESQRPVQTLSFRHRSSAHQQARHPRLAVLISVPVHYQVSMLGRVGLVLPRRLRKQWNFKRYILRQTLPECSGHQLITDGARP